VETKHAGVTVELVPMPVEFKAAENLVEEDVVMAVSARRDSSVEDFELESELKEGLEGFDASLGDADHVVMPAAGDRTPTASQHELNRIASAQAMFGQPWESESEEVRIESLCAAAALFSCKNRLPVLLPVAGPSPFSFWKGAGLAVGVGNCEKQRLLTARAVRVPITETLCRDCKAGQAAGLDM
jgi:hypothetical protein